MGAKKRGVGGGWGVNSRTLRQGVGKVATGESTRICMAAQWNALDDRGASEHQKMVAVGFVPVVKSLVGI